MENELDDILDALQEVDDTDRVSVKTLERQRRQITERLNKLILPKIPKSLKLPKKHCGI